MVLLAAELLYKLQIEKVYNIELDEYYNYTHTNTLAADIFIHSIICLQATHILDPFFTENGIRISKI